jgi:hypothetical protein
VRVGVHKVFLGYRVLQRATEPAFQQRRDHVDAGKIQVSRLIAVQSYEALVLVAESGQALLRVFTPT